MTIIHNYEANKPHDTAYCRVSELTAGDGYYEFVDSGVILGDHSAVIVTDSPGLLLFYDSSTGHLTAW